MTDCDPLQIKYDFFAAYFDLNKAAFVDQSDLNYLPPGGMVRLTMACQPYAPPADLGQLPWRCGEDVKQHSAKGQVAYLSCPFADTQYGALVRTPLLLLTTD